MRSTVQRNLKSRRAILLAAALLPLVVQTLAGWEPAIQNFEAADKTNPPPHNAVEFIGSSSIRLWTNASSLLPGHNIFNRGFGGSHLADSVVFVDRIVIPYRPKLV